MTILVVGGGVAGLAAAYELERAGVSAVLVEAASRVGGKVATERVDGFLVEAGPDSFLAARPAIVQLCHELGLAGELIAPSDPRTVYVRWRGRLVPLPEGLHLVAPGRLAPFLATPLLDPVAKLRAGLDLVLPRSPAARDVALGPFLRRRLGRAFVARIAGPLLGGIHGDDIDRLSLRATLPVLWEMERRHRSLILAALLAGRSAVRGRPQPPGFLSFRTGMGRLVEALASRLRMTDVRLGVRVGSLTRVGDGYRAELGAGPPIEAAGVVLAVPAHVAAAVVARVTPAAADQLATLSSGSTAVVTLGFRRAQMPALLAGHGFVVAEPEDGTLSACTWSSAKWPGRAPVDGILVRGFVSRAPANLPAASDTLLVEAVLADLARTLGLSAAPALVRVHRFRDAMPRYRVGHLDRVAAAEAALDATERGRIALAGASYRGAGVPECIAHGRAAAQRVLASATRRGEATRRAEPAPTAVDGAA